MTKLLVRDAGPADRGELEAMNAALQDVERAMRPSRRVGAAMTAESVEDMLRAAAERDGRVLLAEAGGRAVGFLACHAGRDVLEEAQGELVVSDLYVAPEARGRGVARALVAAAEGHARALGLARLVVATLVANGDAARAYAALGFAPMLLTLERAVGPAAAGSPGPPRAAGQEG